MLNGLERLEYRGYDSAGIAVIDGGRLDVVKTDGRISTLIEKTDGGRSLGGSIGIGHTRWATHGAPGIRNAHPHLSADGRFAAVHNGIIENYVELRRELTDEGYKFVSETDTEVIPQLIQKYYNGDLPAAVRAAVNRLDGSFALGIISTEHPDELIAVRRFSPLLIGVGDGTNYIASDVTALIERTRSVIYLEDDDIAVIKPDRIEIRDKNGCAAERQITRINWDVGAAEKGGFDHFMMKEIAEQPRALRQTIDARVRGREIFFEGISLDAEKLSRIRKINIVACGSAYHAGVVGKYVFEELLRIPTEPDIASEFRYRNPICDENTLTVILSQSGETADTLAAMNEAKAKGSHTLAIVNVVGSSIAKAADDVIYTWAGPEIAVATTKGYTTQLAVLYLFAIWAARLLKTAPESETERLFDGLIAVPEQVEEIIGSKTEQLKKLAKQVGAPEALFFIGRNTDYAIALEGSLKLKEISYVHSEAYAAGELKHGTIALIEPGRTVVALACCDRLFDKLMSNIREVRARGAHIIGCATEGSTAIENEADEVIRIPKIHPLLTPCLEVVPFQIFAYYVALYKGCDIDKPRNLAKSVTVE